MSMQRSRQERFRTQPPPLTWEIPALTAALVLTVVLTTPLVVQGLICGLLAGGFAWPQDQVPEAIQGLGQGHFGVGLDAEVRADLPPDGVMWAATLLGEVLALSALAVIVLGLQRLAGGRSPRGLATPAQAAEALGRRQLRRKARVVRPDLPAARRWMPSTQPAQDLGWRLGRAGRFGPELWVPYDRTTCVIGPQGSGKTLDLLVPALLGAPGAALVTLTKPEDLFLTLQARQHDGRPVAVLDPFDLAPGLPELVWDPVAGCENSMLAERRAKAFAAGTVKGAGAHGNDQAARFYAGECAKVLQAYFHAAALTGRGLDELLTWVANPRQHPQPEEILRTHPAAAPLWDGLLRGALHGDERTAGNTITTVQQALALFFQGSILRRCVPSPGRPATDLTELIRAGGTIYLLGRDDPYASASPLMTALAEHVLDTTLSLAMTSQHGRLAPPFLACLDELPSTTPIPTLRTRMANERALGISFILAAQTWRQLVVCYGEDEARSIYGLSNNVVVFGGGKDIHFYKELSDLLGGTSATRANYSRSGHGQLSRSWSTTHVPVLEPSELRRIPERKALVLSEMSDPIIADLDRCIDGRTGAKLLHAQQQARAASRAARPSGAAEDVAQTALRLGMPK